MRFNELLQLLAQQACRLKESNATIIKFYESRKFSNRNFRITSVSPTKKLSTKTEALRIASQLENSLTEIRQQN